MTPARFSLGAACIPLCALLLAGTASAQPLFCPDSQLDELRRQQPLPLLLGIIPPIAFLHALSRDTMADLPRKPVSFRVVDDRGQPVPNALVGVIHRKDKRFLAEGAAGGAPIGLPHGLYAINAAVADKDRGVRFGSTEVTVDAKGPAVVTVKLIGRAGPAVPGPLVAAAPVGTPVSTDFSFDLRRSSALAVMKQGTNIRTPAKDDQPIVLGQYEMEEGGPREFLLPGKAGKYDVIAMLCAPRIPLTRWTVTATPVQIAIAAPDRVPMGGTIDVTLSGAIASAKTVTFARASMDAGDTEELTDPDKSKVGFNAGYEVGAHQINVVAHDGTVLARRPVMVERREIAITGPDTVALGSNPEFSWAGSGNASLEVWSVANGKIPARQIGTFDEKRLIAPPGPVELRLMRPGSFDVIARKRIKIEGKALAEPPVSETTIGARVEVKTTYDVGFFDQLNFYKRGSKSDYEMSSNRSQEPRVMDAQAPMKPGTYDLVLVLGSVHDKIEVARVPVVVRAP